MSDGAQQLPPEEAAKLFYAGHPMAFVSDPTAPFVCGQWQGLLVYITPLPFSDHDSAVTYFTDNPVIMVDRDALATAPPPEPLPTDPPVNVDRPYCSGSGVIGEPLNCTMGNWQNTPSEYRYQWKKMQSGNPVVLPGATTPLYAPTSQDANKDVYCTVLAINDIGQAAADSNMITVLPPVTETRQHAR